ncbi:MULTISPECIES: hypothetical protein [unclassified Xanthobacter]|uniref:hypothetical protein n=1 Tax=unclassified Xanthobacter TaxID=2623496 RepID=UPI001F362AB3|nr:MULTISPECIES: hypothetical protein [unclassified Xanthobacter]
MKTRTLIGAAILLSTAGVGVALAAAGADHFARHSESRFEHGERDGSHWQRLAESDHRKHRDDASSKRRHHDDDDDDDDDDGHSGRSALPQSGPSDPNAPVPDNGLFQGKARPKVEVQ